MPFPVPTPFAFFRLDALWPVFVPCALGVAAIFLLLPRPRKGRTTLFGVLLGGVALLGVANVTRTGLLSPETVLFYTFAGLAIVSGALLVTQQHPARAALSFALVVLSTSGLFLLLAAPFLMAATIIIYAGAIIVTFLFVLMLASQAGSTDADARTREPLLATALGFLLLGCLIYVLQVSYASNDEHNLVLAIQKQIDQTRDKKAQLSQNNIKSLKDYPTKVMAEIVKDSTDANAQGQVGGSAHESAEIQRQLDQAYIDWPNVDVDTTTVEDLRVALTKLEATLQVTLLRAQQQHGWLLPNAPDRNIVSNLSGPAAVVPNQGNETSWRYDDEQRPPMPADNSAYLGRSLFTDFLLPVELGGVLLLVATIGAIAIAHRRTTPARVP